MFDFIRSARFVAPLGAVLLLPAQAMAFELSGAWATDAGLCNQVFTKKGGEVAFAELSDLYGSGFIIEGDRIKGKNGRCTITSRKQDGANVELAAACATSVMTQNLRFSLKIVDDNRLTRLFSEIPGMAINYARCAPL